MSNLSFEDTENIRKYSKHFKVKVPQPLEDAMSNFDNNTNEETLKSLKIQLCLWLTTASHFQGDSLWETPIKRAKEFLEVENSNENL